MKISYFEDLKSLIKVSIKASSIHPLAYLQSDVWIFSIQFITREIYHLYHIYNVFQFRLEWQFHKRLIKANRKKVEHTFDKSIQQWAYQKHKKDWRSVAAVWTHGRLYNQSSTKITATKHNHKLPLNYSHCSSLDMLILLRMFQVLYLSINFSDNKIIYNKLFLK